MPKREIADFIAYWSAASASERSNSQRFLLKLCDLLAVPHSDHHPNAVYFFEHPVTEHHLDGTTSQVRIDHYKRACFVLESKQSQDAKAEASQLELAAEEAGVVAKKESSQPVRGTDAWDDAMIKARRQAERYVRALPADEPNPPFLVVVDVATPSSSSLISRRPAKPICRFPTRAPSASGSKTSPTRKSAPACASSGPIPPRSTRRASRPMSPAKSPRTSSAGRRIRRCAIGFARRGSVRRSANVGCVQFSAFRRSRRRKRPPLRPSQTQSNRVKLNPTQSNPIKPAAPVDSEVRRPVRFLTPTSLTSPSENGLRPR